MPPARISPPNSGNRLLAALPQDERAHLEPYLEPVELAIKDSLYEYEQPISHLYFPHDGVMSIVHFAAGADPVEVATVGREGMVGFPVFLGAESTAGTAFCQIPGSASRITVEDFRRLVVPGTTLHDLLHHFLQAIIVLMAQNSACNRRHSVEQRCARWLCMTRDRVTSDTFPLKQEFLAEMLGVRRAGVSETASRLRSEGLIRYSRGEIEVLDRPGLEARSCECYWIIRDAFDRMLQAN